MGNNGVEGSKVAKRSSRACERCRSMKVKCSGIFPCTRCERKKERCRFLVEESRVSIPESYLLELERRLNNSGESFSQIPAQNQRDRRYSSHGVTESPSAEIRIPNIEHQNQDDSSHADAPSSPLDQPQPSRESVSEFSRNPLVDTDLSFVKAPDGRHRYMGPSSTWAFCRRVMALIGQRMPEVNSPPDPFNLDGVAFKMQWSALPLDTTPDVSNLPPLDYAIFAYNTAKYHLGLLFQIIDEDCYMRDLHEFYDNPAQKAAESRYWYAEYLLILAFGKALTMSAGATSPLPGCQYATRAMALLPDLSGIHYDTLLGIEVLCLASVYLQSVDMRIAAFQHIGQAVRLCIAEGIHRHLPHEIVGEKLSERCNITFWTVYILERDFSALMGGPMSIRDEDITTKLPSELNKSLTAVNKTLQIRLSRLTAQILTTVYGVGREFDNSYIKNTQSILYMLADISRDLSNSFTAQFRGPISRVSRIATRIMLSYHHCVVLTTRPLVMCALQRRLALAQVQQSSNIFLSPPVSSLLNSCVDSALNILKTLRTLQDEDLLDNFLPFQLECAFSSGFLLCIIRTVAPGLIQDESWSDNIHTILNSMIAKGSVAAPLRKKELDQLEQIMVPLSPIDPQESVNTSTIRHRAPMNLEALSGLENDGPELGNDSIDHDFSWDFFAPNGTTGLSAEDLQDLADQLENDIAILNGPGP